MKRLSMLVVLFLFASVALAQSIPGSWTLYPPQTSTYQVSIRPPVNADGTSVWSKKSTIPIQYNLMQGYGPFTFASYHTPDATHQDRSYLYFQFANPPLFSQITKLSTDYVFALGDCWGGSLRWGIYFQDGSEPVWVYYGTIPADFQPCIGTGGTGLQSGMNMLDASRKAEPRYEWQGHGSPVYDTYDNIAALVGDKVVTAVNLILDSGWKNDQVLAAGYPLNPTVGVDTGSGEVTAMWKPQSGTLSSVCPTDSATIRVQAKDISGNFTIDEDPVSTVPDQGTNFRILDCKYMYNLAGKGLGTGTYKVDIFIGGSTTPASQVTPLGTTFSLK